MDVILHVGAHSAGIKGFGAYMRANAATFDATGVVFWGAEDLRRGLMSGLQPNQLPTLGRNMRKRAIGRVQMKLRQEAERGTQRLWVCDSNLLGVARDNLAWETLYAGAGVRLARYFEAFDGQVTDVVLSVRDLLGFWLGLLAQELIKGGDIPTPARLDKLVNGPRSWRDVVADVACAVPGARVWVAPFEVFSSQPDALFLSVTACEGPATHAREALDTVPDLQELRRAGVTGLPDGYGRWMPFDLRQQAHLRELYADDLMWLQAGADGLAWLLDDPRKGQTGSNPSAKRVTEGSENDDGQGRLAQAGEG